MNLKDEYVCHQNNHVLFLKVSKKQQRKSQQGGDEFESSLREDMDDYGVRAALKPEDQLQLSEQVWLLQNYKFVGTEGRDY